MFWFFLSFFGLPVLRTAVFALRLSLLAISVPLCILPVYELESLFLGSLFNIFAFYRSKKKKKKKKISKTGRRPRQGIQVVYKRSKKINLLSLSFSLVQ